MFVPVSGAGDGGAAGVHKGITCVSVCACGCAKLLPGWSAMCKQGSECSHMPPVAALVAVAHRYIDIHKVLEVSGACDVCSVCSCLLRMGGSEFSQRVPGTPAFAGMV